LKKNVRFVLVLVIFLLSGRAGSGQSQPSSGSAKLLTPEAALNLHFVSDLQPSPDGSRLAFVVSDAPKGERRAQHIWMYDQKTGSVRQFTYSSKSETSPRWSPDGKQLAFLSNRGGEEEQIYLMNAGGGEAAAWTKGKSSIKNFEWSRDGKYIAYIAPDAKSEEEEKK
jgi:Tol biopolymer transport system component